MVIMTNHHPRSPLITMIRFFMKDTWSTTMITGDLFITQMAPNTGSRTLTSITHITHGMGGIIEPNMSGGIETGDINT